MDFVDATDLDKVKTGQLSLSLSFKHLIICLYYSHCYSALTPETTLVWLESPTNPTLTLVDISAIVSIVKSHPSKPVVVVDNTFMSSYFQQPLRLGADVSMQSLTKYTNGHTDVLMGSLVTNRTDLAEKFGFLQLSIGTYYMCDSCISIHICV